MVGFKITYSPRVTSPQQLKYAINRSQQTVAYALAQVSDFGDNQQIKSALSLVSTTQERLRLVEKLTYLRHNQKMREEMDRINAIRPLLLRVKDKLHRMVEASKAKSHGENADDFEKAGARRKNRLNFISLMQITKNAQDERIELLEDIDKEYLNHRNERIGVSCVGGSQMKIQMKAGMHQFMRKLDESQNMTPRDTVIKLPTSKQSFSERNNKYTTSKNKLSYLTKQSDAQTQRPIQRKSTFLPKSANSVVQRRRKIEFKKDAISKVNSMPKSPKGPQMTLFSQDKKKLLQPSSLYEYFSKKRSQDLDSLF